MQDNPYRSPEGAQKEDAGPITPGGETSHHPGIRGSIAGACVLLVLDVVLSGSFLMSYLACPIWFLISVVKNAIQRPAWRLALLRIAVPALTLGLVLGNNALQWKIAEANAERIIKACEEFRTANGKYPSKLDDLVPGYLKSVPRAKYCLCLFWGEFHYWNDEEVHAMLVWCKIPPFGTKIYTFEDRRWGYTD
jgi:hypothetical protein